MRKRQKNSEPANKEINDAILKRTDSRIERAVFMNGYEYAKENIPG